MDEVEFLAALNPSQRQAVQHFCGPLLVVAGAGSGKTRALAYRIAYLLLHHRVDPESLLAVTFTNKAAQEMRQRIDLLLGQHSDQPPISSRYLWIGTFHALCTRLLRFDITKYQHPQGYQWTKDFSILDEGDAQGLVKDIVTKQLNLDEKRFEPRQVRYAISGAKNLGLNPADFAAANPDYRGRVLAEVYELYQKQLGLNNALDFDDLIWLPVLLLEQNESLLGYWHYRFRHILVDEYQDTNRIQYRLLYLLATLGESHKPSRDWGNRSIFAVGDADQSIYSFRGADFRILLAFQEELGDGLPEEDTRTLIKLEENYRSTATILDLANHLIKKNQERIDKVLRPTRGQGAAVSFHRADDETREALFVLQQLRHLVGRGDFTWNSCAVLYRTNAQSRAFEDALVQGGVPYRMVGGLRFYERKEVKDILAYLRVVINPADSLSLLRIVNVPPRGIGKASLDNLTNLALQAGISLEEVFRDPAQVKAGAIRAAKGIEQFMELMCSWRARVENCPVAELVQQVMEESGYCQHLRQQDTEEARERLGNLEELYNAALEFAAANPGASLADFLASASLASELDHMSDQTDQVTLMTLHASKGLEFPVVFLVGLEQGLFPSFRSLQNPAALEEERRLCYVGITRAQERLYITHACERRLWGRREPAVPSVFLQELAPSALATNQPQCPWQPGDRLVHPALGSGRVVRVLGSGEKLSLAIHFPGYGQKIIDPRQVKLRRSTGSP